jgi:hypothetical protein
MSLTFGYDLKDGDKILEAPLQVSRLLGPLSQPGAALVNYFPFCAVSIPSLPLVVSHGYLQYDTSLHGSRTSVTNHWRKSVGS